LYVLISAPAQTAATFSRDLQGARWMTIPHRVAVTNDNDSY